jgi:putative two-component system response regulator
MAAKAHDSHRHASAIRRAYEDLQQAHEDIKEAYMAIALRLAILAEYRDPDTGAHILRISDYGCEVAKALKLHPKEIEIYRFASPLHDIGKIAIPDDILKKPGKLTAEEREVMKGHTVIGARMFDGSDSPILKGAADICRSHHEKWDGTGYPYGLKGEQIPLLARIVAVVDVFDALVSKRYYKDAWSVEDGVKYLRANAGTHFDPRVVRAFLKTLDSIRQIHEANRIIHSFIADYGVLAQKFG